jgi:GDPmannose 4,6-dehydratase
VQRCVEIAFDQVGLDWQQYVVQDDRFLRPAEVDLLVGDASRARSELGWQQTVDFAELVGLMVDADLQLVGAARR